MLKKRGLILILILLVLVNSVDSAPRSATVIDDTPQSSYLSCDDGTRFATCKPNTNLFCSNQNIILNSGFESDSNQDGIPNLFSPDPNSILGTDLLISQDSLAGLKSILITKQWTSFDYQAPFFGATVLQPSTDYVFFSFVKGTCNNLRVYYSQQQTGPANELCGSSRVCTLIPIVNGWSRLVTQFSSDEIVTTIPRGNVQVPIIQNLRVECADSTPFELFVDNLHLQPLNAPPQLIKNCQICGSCPSGLSCAPDGSCVSDLSSFYTDDELMERCIAENNFALCERIQSPVTKPIAFNQFAVENNDISKCQNVICEQSVLYFSCLDQGRANCNEESLSAFTRNPNFENGGDVYIRYHERQSNNERIDRFKLGSGREHPLNRCEIHVKRDLGGTFDDDYYYYSLGTIISEDSNLWNLATEKPEGRQTYFETTNNFPWFMARDCGSNNCNLLEGDVISPKADLLCGGDARWHLCDRDGIKTSGIIGFEEFLCDGETGTWVEII